MILLSHHYQKFYHKFWKFRGMNVCSIPPTQKLGGNISLHLPLDLRPCLYFTIQYSWNRVFLNWVFWQSGFFDNCICNIRVLCTFDTVFFSQSGFFDNFSCKCYIKEIPTRNSNFPFTVDHNFQTTSHFSSWVMAREKFRQLNDTWLRAEICSTHFSF